MKITKFVHSCLLVEMPGPVNRTALFDPGIMSEAALDVSQLEFLDDMIYTHSHSDHLSVPLLKQLVAKFPQVRITAPTEIVDILAGEGITASDQPSEGIVLFDSPHEAIRPYLDSDPPQQIGVHYLDLLTDPGDSHSFDETKAILALPVQAPWGSVRDAVALGLRLKPRYIVPIHDWHWSDDARNQAYDKLENLFGEQGISFTKPQTGVPFVLDV
jgi:L-ascorbate metabolism protein UlaG (beta-lactamase superfamily)